MLEFIDQYKYIICVILSVLAFLFIVYGHNYREQVQLYLKNEFFKLPKSSIDYWSLSHLLLFGLFGFIIPNQHFSFLTIGVAWELFEDYLCNDRDTQLVDCKIKENKQESFWCNGLNDDYWYANYSDIFSNIVGYVIGSSIRTTFC